MLNLLAQAVQETSNVIPYAIGGGTLGTLFVTALFKHITNRNIHIEDNMEYQRRDLCEERHENIGKILESMSKKQDVLFVKVDKVLEKM